MLSYYILSKLYANIMEKAPSQNTRLRHPYAQLYSGAKAIAATPATMVATLRPTPAMVVGDWLTTGYPVRIS